MNSIERLSELFSKFPGIGPRQARRFVYYLLSKSSGSVDELINSIENLKKEISQCSECLRYFPKAGEKKKLCAVCADDGRDSSLLCVVHKDIDLDAIEKSGTYKGYYFVLGGSLPILEKEPEKRIRIKGLESRIKNRLEKGLKEVVLAMNANAEGENTALYIKELFRDLPLTFSLLGRGLSTGAELEYADPETLRNAFLHRTK